MDIYIDERDCGMSGTTVGGVRCDLIATLQNMFTSNSPERQMKHRTEGKTRAVYNIYHIVTWNKQALIFFFFFKLHYSRHRDEINLCIHQKRLHIW